MVLFRRRRLICITFIIASGCVVLLCFQFFFIHLLTPLSHEAGGRFSRGARPRHYQNDAVLVEGDKQLYIERLQNRSKHSDQSSSSKILIDKPIDQSHSSKVVIDKAADQSHASKSSADSHINQSLVSKSVRTLTRTLVPVSFHSWQGLEDYYRGVWKGKGAIEGQRVWRGNESQQDQRLWGVHPAWHHLYQGDSHRKTFTCLFSKEVIPMTQVNDDYCDCSDSTDEPGTAACTHSRFYCRYQDMEDYDWLVQSRVNDGVCDCCDGSDEWMRATERATGVCEDVCDKLREGVRGREEMWRRGEVIRRQYISEGSQHPNPNHLYGEEGEFYVLSTRCVNQSSAGRYLYEICPFKSIKQSVMSGQDGAGSQVVIGRNGRWISSVIGHKNEGGGVKLVLEMGEGDIINCPTGKPRSTKVEFICGLKDEIEQISESEVCSYYIIFITPAACTPQHSAKYKHL